MSSAVDTVVNVATLGLAKDTSSLVKGLTLGAVDLGDTGSTSSYDAEADAESTAQDNATNAARTASAKKKATTNTVLTSPLGTSTTAATAVTKLGGL